MPLVVKILVLAVSSGFFSALIFVVFAFVGFLLFAKNMGIAFIKSPEPITKFDDILIILCAVGALASLMICPFIAYYVRQTVFDISPNIYFRIFLFGLVGFSQVIFLIFTYFFLFPKIATVLNKLINKKINLRNLKGRRTIKSKNAKRN